MTHFSKLICRLLIALMLWTPFQAVQAGLIGTDQAVTSTSAQDRSAVLGFVTRSDVAGQLQALGLDPASARDRVAAMSDDEVRSIAGRIQALPAGAEAVGVLVIILLVLGIYWLFNKLGKM